MRMKWPSGKIERIANAFSHGKARTPVCSFLSVGVVAAMAALQAVAGVTNGVIPYAATEIEVDGSLAEPAWQDALSLGPFVGPLNGGAEDAATVAVNRTEAKLLWRGDRLYAAFLCRSPRPAWSTYTRHDDPLHGQDVCEIFVRTREAPSCYAEFQASPLGTTLDLFHTWAHPPEFPVDQIDWQQVAQHHGSETSWNPDGVAAACGPLVADAKRTGWVIELAIPLKAVREREGLEPRIVPGQTVWINLLRYVQEPDANGQRELRPQNWAPVMKGCPHVSPMAMRPLVLASLAER